jgi:alkylated DNA repair dioxygenase AlkB
MNENFKIDRSVNKILENKSKIIYIPNFISSSESKKLYDELVNNPNWMQGTYQMFGKPVKTPRLLWAMRNETFDVPSSYNVTGNSIYSKLVDKLKKKVEKRTKHVMNYAQLNYYRDGQDYIGWHSDSEVKKGDLIASISLGAERKFSLRHKDYKTNKDIPKYNFKLGNGSLLIMDYNTANKYWKHSLPKMKNVSEGRINITFRDK